jgi:hypothetical protein
VSRFRFDDFVFADYSGALAPAAQRRGIALWRRPREGRARKVPGPFTREGLRRALLAILAEATRRGRRVLFGIDYQWSWPLDLWRAAGLEGLAWRRALAALVDGAHDRPPLGPPATFAAAFNAYAAADVFHCRVTSLARRYGLPTRPSWAGDAVRLTERAMRGTKPATRLGGTGAVAGQTLTGLVQLHLLLEEAAAARLRVLVWPMDGLVDDGRSHVGVEIYPSFCRPRAVRKSDDADARACCDWAAEADLPRVLDLRRAPRDVRLAAAIEGWILGAPVSPSPGATDAVASAGRGGSRG